MSIASRLARTRARLTSSPPSYTPGPPRSVTPRWIGLAVVLLITIILVSQAPLRLQPLSPAVFALPILATVALVVLFASAAGALGSARSGAMTQALGAPARIWSWRWTLALVSVLGAVALVLGVRNRASGASYGDVTVLWIAINLAFVVAAGLPLRWPRRSELGAFLARTEVRVVVVLLVAATLLRVVDLEHTPRHFMGDEGVFGFAAMDTITGALKNPFATGWTANPTLVYFLQGAFMRIFGETILGVRLLMAVGGVLGVLVTYLWLRTLFGVPTALVGGVLLASCHAHIYFSRTALRHSWDSVWVPLTLLFFYLGMYRRAPWAFALAGVTAGLAQYWYFGTRILPVILIALVVYALIFDRGRIAPVGLTVVLLAGGFVLAMLPLLVYYVEYPAAFLQRIQTVTSGYYSVPDLAQRTGESEVSLYWQNIWRTLLAYHRVPPEIPFYQTARPLLDPVSGTFVLVGLAACIARWRDIRYVMLLATVALVMAVVSITENAPQAQRLFTNVSALIGLVAIGLVEGFQLIGSALGTRPRAVRGATALLTALVAGLSIWLLFGEYLPSGRDMYGNSEVATELAYYLRDQGQPVTYYFYAEPRMSTTTHPNLPFIARQIHGIDVPPPPAAPPSIEIGPQRTLFVFLPERLDELPSVQDQYPGPAPLAYVNGQDQRIFYIYRPDASP